MKTVAVFGASGFVGSNLTEYLMQKGEYKVRPVIHSSGNAWRLARRSMDMRIADLRFKEQIQKAIAGCDFVVDCTFPPEYSMIPVIKNLLEVCLSANIQRFVHFSSILVYGESPLMESEYEHAAPRAEKGSYGWYKERQDRLVERFHQKGLPSVVLCPPNISGPNSRYILEILAAIQNGQLVLINQGDFVCNLVDVMNLVVAIEKAMSCEKPDGKRIFVTDDEGTTWNKLVEALMPLADDVPEPASISLEEAQEFIRQHAKPSLSMAKVAKKIMDFPQTRTMLAQNAMVKGAYDNYRRIADALPAKTGTRLKGFVKNHPGRISKSKELPMWSARLCEHQLRKVRHSCERARTVLDYAPLYSFSQSMMIFRHWYTVTHGYRDKWWPLTRELYPHANRIIM